MQAPPEYEVKLYIFKRMTQNRCAAVLKGQDIASEITMNANARGHTWIIWVNACGKIG